MTNQFAPENISEKSMVGWMKSLFWDFCYFTGAMAMLVSGSYSLPLPFLFLLLI